MTEQTLPELWKWLKAPTVEEQSESIIGCMCSGGASEATKTLSRMYKWKYCDICTRGCVPIRDMSCSDLGLVIKM